MKNFTIFLVMMALLLAGQTVIGQTDETKSIYKVDSPLCLKSGEYRPFLEFNYGTSTPRFEGLEQPFATLGIVELKIGYSSQDSLKYNLMSSDQQFGFVSFVRSDLSSSAGAGEIDSEMTRFGFGNRRGVGYAGGFKFEMYNQDAIDWTKLSPVDYESMSEEAQEIFDHYGSTYRFGQLVEAGLRFPVTKSFSLNAGAEGAVILPRYVFWPWLGSVAIYSGVQGALEIFSDNIIEASPTAGPVIAFLLKTGVSAGYYYLLREDMNWPFGYEKPVTVESIKIGANFVF